MNFEGAHAGGSRALALALVVCALAAAPARAQSTQPFSSADPVAMVEEVENAPGAGVEMLDYVYADQEIELGARGVLVLSYFDSCRRESISGGRVSVGARKSRVRGGRVRAEPGACEGETAIVTADASEAGGAVKRVTPFKAEEWREVTIKGARPVFKWKSARRGGMVEVLIANLDTEPIGIVWSGQTAKSYLAYPPNAPALIVGMPYMVQISVPGGTPMVTVFSIDPWLDIADTAANRVVAIGQ